MTFNWKKGEEEKKKIGSKLKKFFLNTKKETPLQTLLVQGTF